MVKKDILKHINLNNKSQRNGLAVATLTKIMVICVLCQGLAILIHDVEVSEELHGVGFSSKASSIGSMYRLQPFLGL